MTRDCSGPDSTGGRKLCPAMSSQLTVIIPCKNERENIRACVASARQVADEVVVADSGSTDGTLEIAHELGCPIIQREYGTSGDFKNWAIPQAAHEWVFILDADERISADLAQEIRDTVREPKHDGYWIYRLNHFMGHPICHGPWRNDRCLRLFRRDVGHYVGPTDHAEVKLGSGTVGRLGERLVHYTCTSYSQYLPKISRYAEVQAQLWNEDGRRPKLRQLLFRFPVRFIQGYVLRLGFLDGLAGLQVCALVAYLSWLKQAYLWQLQSCRDTRELDRAAIPTLLRTPGPAGSCQINNLSEELTDAEESAGGASGTQTGLQAAKRRTFREWRHRVTPQWLRTDSRRRRRNIVLRRL